jgi:hypothetical protein
MVSKNSTLTLICIALLIALFMPCVSAEVLHPEMVDCNKTMSYADLGLSGPSDVQIWVSDTLVETGNTTAGHLCQPLNDYTVVQKPTLGNRWINNPRYLLDDAVSYLVTFGLPLFIIAGFLLILAKIGRRR